MKTKKKIKKLLDKTDFKKMHDYMMNCNPPWTWADGFVPTKTALKEEAKRLLKVVAVVPEKVAYIGTGGIFVMKWHDELNLLLSIEWKEQGDEE